MELAGLSPAHLISVVGRTLAHPVFLIIAHYKYYYLGLVAVKWDIRLSGTLCGKTIFR